MPLTMPIQELSAGGQLVEELTLVFQGLRKATGFILLLAFLLGFSVHEWKADMLWTLSAVFPKGERGRGSHCAAMPFVLLQRVFLLLWKGSWPTNLHHHKHCIYQ